jgi:hypothetical protein
MGKGGRWRVVPDWQEAQPLAASPLLHWGDCQGVEQKDVSAGVVTVQDTTWIGPATHGLAVFLCIFCIDIDLGA